MRMSDWSSDVCSSDLPARRAFDQRHAQFLLQLADLGGERGLADEARPRGAAAVQVLGEGDEVLEVTPVHGFPPLRAARGCIRRLRSWARPPSPVRCSGSGCSTRSATPSPLLPYTRRTAFT